MEEFNEDEPGAVNEIVHTTDPKINTENIKKYRLGKKEQHIGPLKVVLISHEDAAKNCVQ